MELRDIIKEAVAISERATFKEALARMVSEQTNTLLAVDGDGKLSGAVGVAELLDAVVPEYLDGDSIAAAFASEDLFTESVQDAAQKIVVDFMSHDPHPINIDDGLMAVAATAIADQRSRIPVVDKDDRPIGIVSRRGLKQMLAKELGIADSA
ncbi:MAG: CBS domain-containing protein [Candidatus Pacebacteria bacterium]|nr:CBS domain-containing protein [Candidatus Paceibacterota bacterium]